MISKLRFVFAITIAFLSFSGFAQTQYWQHNLSQKSLNQSFSNRFNVQNGQVFSFDEKLFRTELNTLSVAKGNSRIVYLPNEDGESVAFQVHETPVFSAELSLKYPDIKSYSGLAMNGSNDKVRFSVSHNGIQSMIVHSDLNSSTFMQKDAGETYVVYSRDANTQKSTDFVCSTVATVENKLSTHTLKPLNGQVLRKFRLAVTASGEYTQYHGGTVADALAAINATVTRINEVFETDLGVQLELVADTDEVIFTDPDTDPYSGSLSSKVQAELTATIGEANYDIGILFNQAADDGNAGFIGAVCKDGEKGSAYASTLVPEGDVFDLDYVAHEMGHQFGANHTWSFSAEGTGVQVEPASGTTIMGYAGIVGVDNVALNGDDYFHYATIVQISEYLETISCAETIDLANNPPVITPAGSFTIPISTAFVLKGEATDVDVDDVLTFNWEQIDDGIITQSSFGPSNVTGANFRSVKPSTSPERYFPNLASVISGDLTQTSPQVNSAWETVSEVEKEMNFAFTVRDNAIGGGQVVSDLVNVFVDNSTGPFVVTSQNTNVTTFAGGIEEVVWDVANTNRAPVNAQTVDIYLSVDGGDSFSILLAEDVYNDGSHLVQIPANPTTEARIMIKAHDNIFFAVNSSDFIIELSEVILNFEVLEYEICRSDILVVPFVYETDLGFSEEVTFSIVSPPAGLDIVIFPETATDTDTPVEITFTSTNALEVGNYTIQVLATSATQSKEVVFDLNAYDTNFTELTLIAPLANAVAVSTLIELEWEADILASNYDIQIALDNAFTTIIESSNVVNNSYFPVNLENAQTYYWRVKPINSCAEGEFGTAFSFVTINFSCETKQSVELPIIISPSGTPTITSSITIFDDLQVADINVNLEVDHSYLSDLLVTLTSPSGTKVVLLSNSCVAFENLDATFDDQGFDFVCGGDPAISGTVKPAGFLSSFNGESTLGEWVLSISDNVAADGGSLKVFSLEICAEGDFRPDADEDGVFDDGPDLCLDTPSGSQVDASGCPVLVISATNYTIAAQSESCISSNDGAIEVAVIADLAYSVTISGEGVNTSSDFETSTFTFNDLSAGSYNLCITATDGAIVSQEQCFSVVISEPETLSVSSTTSIDGSVLELVLEGASLYTIELNGVLSETEENALSLDLEPGLNTLKVSTNLPCQGFVEEQILFASEPLVYPNPVDDLVQVFLGVAVDEIEIRVFTADGRFIQGGLYQVNETQLELDLSVLATGLYFIQFEGENILGTSKIIKR